jgi:hypothetical protein
MEVQEITEEERNWGAEEWRAPTLQDGDLLLFSEGGRVVRGNTYGHDRDSIDYRSHYFRIVRNGGSAYLLVKHGGGEERLRLDYNAARAKQFFEPLDSTQRYLLMHAFYSVARNARNAEHQAQMEKYTKAFAEGRLKKRKKRGGSAVSVWIEGAS